MQIEPLNDRVLVSPIDEDETSAGGIIIPANAKEKPTRGAVVAVGPGKLREDGTRTPLHVTVGDVVLYGKYSGTSVSHGDAEYLLLREDEIFAIDRSGS